MNAPSRHAQVFGPGDIRAVPDDAPAAAGPSDLLCRILAAGVCGTDVSSVRDGEVAPDQVPGHEILAQVVQSPDETQWPLAARVMIRPIRGCGDCWYCTHGLVHQCDHSVELTVSSGRPGGFADFIVITDPVPDEVVTVADGVDDLDAVWAEPLSVALHAVRTAVSGGSGRLVVVGAGPLGLCAVAAAGALGLHVTAVEPRAARRAAALSVGAESALDPASSGIPQAGQVLTTVGSAAALALAHDICALGGRVVHAGLGHGTLLPEHLGPTTAIGSFGYLPAEFMETTALINKGRVQLSRLVTHELSLDEIATAVRLPLVDSSTVKVVVRP